MRYLVFDIECANCFRGNGKICSFGFVISDENFNVLAKDDILINPLSAFHLNAHRANKEVKLAYSEQQFYAAAPFPAHYSRIKQLLEYPDQIVIGHAIMNDVNYLNSETKRFGLKSFDFKYFDSHLLYADYCGDGHPRALDRIAEEFDINFLPHRSDEDSYATLMYVKAICNRYGLTLEQAIQKAGIHMGSIHDYSIKPTFSDRDEEFKKAMASADKIKSRRADVSKFVERKGLQSAEQGKFKGMTVTFGDSFYLRELSVIRYVISTIYAEGGACTGYIDEANTCVLAKDEMSPAGGVDGVKIITEERFFEILGMNYDDIKRKISAPVKRYHGKSRKRTLPNGKKRNDNNNVNIKKSIDKQ